MVFIYGIIVNDSAQADAKGRPLRYEHYDDAATAAATITGAAVVCVDWCAKPPPGTHRRGPAGDNLRPFARARPACR